MNKNQQTFLAVQSTYSAIEYALYTNENCVEKSSIPKIKASSDLIPSLEKTLKKQSLTINEISFIGINQGPAPFTTLRVAIATINSIAFSLNTDVIGIDGLQAIAQEYFDSQKLPTVILLNAFANDVYYALQTSEKETSTGCCTINELLEKIVTLFPDQKIRFMGNGCIKHKEKIVEIIKNKATIEKTEIGSPSIEYLALIAAKQYHSQKEITHQVLPLYLKKHWIQKKA